MAYTYQDLQKWNKLQDEVGRKACKSNFVRRERMRLTTAIAWLEFICESYGWEVCKNIFLCRCYEVRKPIAGTSEYNRIIIRFGKYGGYREVSMYVGNQLVGTLPTNVLNRDLSLSPRELRDMLEAAK